FKGFNIDSSPSGWVAGPESSKGVLVSRRLSTPFEDSGRATRRRCFGVEILVDFLGHPGTEKIAGVVDHPTLVLVFTREHAHRDRAALQSQDAGIGARVAHRTRLVRDSDALRQKARELGVVIALPQKLEHLDRKSV